MAAANRHPAAAGSPGRLARWRRRASDALPAPATIIFGSAIWGVVMAATAMIGVWLQNGMIVTNAFAIAGVYFYGGSLAFAPGYWLARLVLGRRGRFVRLIGGALVIALTVHLATSAIFALQYRVFYSHWHADFPDIIWFFQLGFTSIGAAYMFTAGGLIFYWPLSLIAFLGFGLWFASKGVTSSH